MLMVLTTLKLEYDEDGGKVTREWHFSEGAIEPLDIAREVSALIGQRIEESQKTSVIDSVGTCDSCGGPIWPSKEKEQKDRSDSECCSSGEPCIDHVEL